MLGFGSGLQMWVHTKFYNCPMLETIQEVARLCCTTYAGGGNSRNLTCTCDDGTLPLSIVHRPRRPPCRGNGARIQFPPPQPQMPPPFPPPSSAFEGQTSGRTEARDAAACFKVAICPHRSECRRNSLASTIAPSASRNILCHHR